MYINERTSRQIKHKRNGGVSFKKRLERRNRWAANTE